MQDEDLPGCGIILFWVVVVIIGISGFISLIVMSSSPTFSNATVAKAAFGLEADKPYPLRLGRRIEGSGGTSYASTGFFSAQAATNIQPASALSVAFHHGERSYILELPMRKIVFLQREGVPETIRISLEGERDGDRYGVLYRGIFIPRGSKPLEENDWFTDLKNDGQLGDFLSDEYIVKSIQITLSPEHYTEILG